MSDLLVPVERAILAQRLLSRGQSLLVGVSGGLDSMVLLRVLCALSQRHRWRLTIAHFNHRLRGRSSQADERLVRRTARKLGLPLIIESADVRMFAYAQRLSLEMAARQLRHGFLARAARTAGAKTIALAHHADDQVELFFLRLFRGSGGRGLAGMRWRNPSPADPSVEIIRPLLAHSKAELRQFAHAGQVPFREDASNACLEIQRNRVRHEFLPLLRRRYQPALEKTVLRVMDLLGADAEFALSSAEAWLKQQGYGRKTTKEKNSLIQPKWPARFDALPLALQRRILQLQLLNLGLAPEFDLIESLRCAVEQPIEVARAPSSAATEQTPGPVRVTRTVGGLVRLEREQRIEFGSESQRVSLDTRTGKVVFGGAIIQWRLRAEQGSHRPSPRPGRELFDARRVGSPICLRHWQPGDRFQPCGMSRSVKLQDLFTNAGVQRSERHRLLVATTAQGALFWVEGLRISEAFKLTNATTRRLHWAWQRL